MQATHRTAADQDQLQTAQDLYQKMQVMQHQRTAVQASGLPALRRLVDIARRETGQSRVVAGFLLALYNGHDYPFTLTDLRALDQEIHSDCMAVLIMDWSPEREVHELIENGPTIWQSLIKRWA